MDVLSSQATISGYAAVIEGARYSTHLFPMLMTAAGSLKPAKVFVLGAGVVGLQAIATAHRLGARVTAYDVRPEVKEQVQSVGGHFLEIEGIAQSSEGGYAKTLSADSKKKVQAALSETLSTMDVVITTALTLGGKAPILLTKEMCAALKKGSVVVDVAAAMGGNTALTKPGEIIHNSSCTIVGHRNFPGLYPKDASHLYARNLANVLGVLCDDKGEFERDKDTEIFDALRLTQEASSEKKRGLA